MRGFNWLLSSKLSANAMRGWKRGSSIVKLSSTFRHLVLLAAVSMLVACASSTLPPVTECQQIPVAPPRLMQEPDKLQPITGTAGNGEVTGVELVDSVAGNYAICHQNARQLRALQDWVGALPAR